MYSYYVEENLLARPAITNLHARTTYDNIRPEGVADLKRWILTEGHKFHLRAREIMSRYDQDVNPDPSFEGRGVKVSLGSYGFVTGGSDGTSA